jgi:hypothetical protein
MANGQVIPREYCVSPANNLHNGSSFAVPGGKQSFINKKEEGGFYDS